MAKQPLDLTKTLTALDYRNKEYYSKLTKEEQKAFQPFVLMRYMSSVPDKGDLPYLSLVSINEIVNSHFWELSKEVELQAKLLAASGLGQKTYHKWIPPKNKRKTILRDLVRDYFKQKNWFCNNLEIDVYLAKITLQDLEDLCDEFAKTKEDKKKIIEEFKAIQM